MKRSIKISFAVSCIILIATFFLWFKVLGYAGLNATFACLMIMVAGMVVQFYFQLKNKNPAGMRKSRLSTHPRNLSILIGEIAGLVIFIVHAHHN